jgi:ADP-ribosyl-[dinitrogen reductase] hydrolase
MTITKLTKSKLLGILLGQIIGDSLGGRYEFQSGEIVKNMIYRDLDKNGFLNILGKGPFDLIAGQVTDDTELALTLFHNLIDNGIYDNNSIATNYIKWCHSNPFDIGITTRNAFDDSINYIDCVNNSIILDKKFYKKNGIHNSSNGCLMRISPLAIFGYLQNIPDNELALYAKDNCNMTNPSEIAIDAVVVYVLSVRYSITSYSRTEIWEYALSKAKTDTVKGFLTGAYKKIRIVTREDGVSLSTDQNIGYLGHAFQNSFYELLHGTSFYNSIVNVISLGGDTDTNACICGALLGAYYGIDNIPNPWIDTILNIEYGNNHITQKNRFVEFPHANPNLAINKLLTILNN